MNNVVFGKTEKNVTKKKRRNYLVLQPNYITPK